MGAAIALLLLASQSAYADLNAAKRALISGDDAAAYHEYETAAQLGNPTAQYLAGVMLLRGQGVARDLISGAAWLLAAKKSGLESDDYHTSEVLGALASGQAAAAGKLADERVRDATLLVPAILPKLPNTYARRGAKMSTSKTDDFFKTINPYVQSLNTAVAWVMLRVIVGSDNRIADLWAIETAPTGEFEFAAIESARTMTVRAGRQDRRPAASSFTFLIKHQATSISRDSRMKASFAALVAKATAGDNQQRYALARMSCEFEELRANVLPPSEALTWMRDLAAEPEQGPAMYFLNNAIVAAGAPELSREERFQWVLRSARAGFAPAQLDMALMCWSERTARSLTCARQWLEPAALSGFAPASRYLAALLLSSEFRQVEPARALQLVKPLLDSRLYKGDAATWQLAAASYAALGQREEAIRHQRQAVTLLKGAKRDTSEFVARLSAIEAGADFDGELLAIPPAGHYW